MLLGEEDGEEGNEESSMDEGRGAHAEDARGPADEDNCDRAQAQAERGCGVSGGIKAGRDAGRRSREERGMKLFDETEASKPDPLKRPAVLVPVKATLRANDGETSES
jgi:hypothetical protein